MTISPAHLEECRTILRRFRRHTTVPKTDNWRRRDDDDIWARVIGQVIVVGGSAPADTFWKDDALRTAVSYTSLVALSDAAARKRIHSVLRRIGARYASAEIAKCRKTAALAHNLRVLRHTNGGPHGFLKRLAQLTGPSQDRRRIKYLMKCLWYIRSKGSRDLLMELGLVRDAIALDVRVMNVLQGVGLAIPVKQVQSNPSVYDEVEAAVLTGICVPLGLLGIEFDRMLYQNYDAIMKGLNRST